MVLVRWRPASPSHYLALCWFWSHVGRRESVAGVLEAPICCFSNLFLSAVRGGTGVCGFPDLVECPRCRVVLLVGPRPCGGDTWLFLLDLVEVRDIGACVMRLWSHVVALVFLVFGLTRVVVEAFTLFPPLCSTLQ
ncbi:hypothetical protein Taro_030212 [Colocasia esculenta]|uniref:Uncharacterized protein n=1 Tax=Colocasia esculenta TaxID=4460 RepID=A0A843W2N2_COLES|nr:hypothetical protein [Colocasia esculenta]